MKMVQIQIYYKKAIGEKGGRIYFTKEENANYFLPITISGIAWEL